MKLEFDRVGDFRVKVAVGESVILGTTQPHGHEYHMIRRIIQNDLE